MPASQIVTFQGEELYVIAFNGCIRHISAVARGAKSRMQPAYEPWKLDMEGCYAEAALAKYLMVWWTSGEWHGDDVAGGYQVRSSPYASAHLALHPNDADDAPFVLVTGECPTYNLRGWVWGREAKQRRYWRSNLPLPAFWVPQSDLRPMAELPRWEQATFTTRRMAREGVAAS